MDKQLLRLPEVLKLTGLSRSSIYQRVQDKTFPANIKLGSRTVAWLASEIHEWIESCVEESRNLQEQSK